MPFQLYTLTAQECRGLLGKQQSPDAFGRVENLFFHQICYLLHPAQSMASDPNRSLRMKALNKDGAVTRGKGMETLHLDCHCYKESNPEFSKEINSIEVN